MKPSRTHQQHAYTVFALIALAILLLASLARFHQLGAQSLWNDEGNAYVQATRTFADIADNAARDIHPPGYYWMLAVWRGLVGESEFALRALSALAGVLTVAFTYGIGRHLFSPIAGLLAMMLVALNSFSVYYSQEMRMYALLALWVTASMWLLIGFINTRDTRQRGYWALGLALVNTAGLFTQYSYPLYMLAQGAIVLLWLVFQAREGQLRRLGRVLLVYVGLNLLTIVLYLPWLPTAIQQITTWPNTGDDSVAGLALTTIVGWLSIGITAGMSRFSIAFPFFALFGLLTYTGREARAHEARLTSWRMLFPVLWVIVPVGIFLLMGLYRPANLKFLLPAQVGLALWIGRGGWILWRLTLKRSTLPILRFVPKAAALLGTLAMFTGLIQGLQLLYSDADYQRDDYRGIVQTIERDAVENHAVILNAPGQSEVFGYYYDGDLSDVYPLPVGLTVDNQATQDAVLDIITDYARIYAVYWGTDERDPDSVVENLLAWETFEIDSQWYGRVRLVRYVTEGTLGEPIDVNAQFGDIITLRHYALNGEVFSGGDVLQVQLSWVANESPLAQRYKVFVQLLNPDGTLAVQRDAEPVANRRPTTTWDTGEFITDNHALLLPDDLPAGAYTLIVGLYDSNDASQRLPLADGDYLTLQQITVR